MDEGRGSEGWVKEVRDARRRIRGMGLENDR